MTAMKTYIFLALLGLFLVTPTYAADTASGATTTMGTPIMGRDSAGKARFVKIDDTGAVVTSGSGGSSTTTQPPVCGSPHHDNVTFGTTAVLCPTTRGVGSNWILLCNQGPTNIRVRFDGVDPTTSSSSPGIVLAPNDCFSDYIAAVPRCISDQVGAILAITECNRP